VNVLTHEVPIVAALTSRTITMTVIDVGVVKLIASDSVISALITLSFTPCTEVRLFQHGVYPWQWAACRNRCCGKLLTNMGRDK
jgi:hypothetical protein